MSHRYPRHLNVLSLNCPDTGAYSIPPLFFSQGTSGALAVDDSDGSRPLLQHCAADPQWDLRATGPALPLIQPNEAKVPWGDICVESRKTNEIDFRKLRTSLMKLKTNISSAKTLKDLRSYLSHLSSVDSTAVDGSKKMPYRLRNLFKKYPEMLDSKQVSDFNEDYSGGCLSYEALQEDNEKGILIFPHGKDMDNIRLDLFEMREHKLLCKGNPLIQKLEYPILEVQSSMKSNRLLCLLRSYAKCCLYSARVSEESVENWDIELESNDSHATSVCTSPYIHGEWLKCDEAGTVKLYCVNKKERILCENHQPRFSSHSTWLHAHYASHPRLVTLADRTGVETLDIRVPSNQQSMDLFVLPHKLLFKEEHLLCTRQHTARHFYHFVVTDYNVFVVDERFPVHPVLHWSHTLTSPPQYMEIIDNAVAGHDVLLLSSQSKAETESFQLSFEQQIVQSTCPPWRLSRFDDILRLDSVLYPGYDMLAVEKRLNSSLIGTCGLPHSGGRGFTALQLNSFGDLFGQTYLPMSAGEDKTYRAGPGSCEVNVKSEDRGVIADWLQVIHRQIEEASFKMTADVEQSHDLSEKFKSAVCHEVFPHLLCMLCSSVATPSSIPDDKLNDVCLSCGNTIQESRDLKLSGSTNRVFPSTRQVKDLTTLNAQSFSDPDSQVYFKLWNGDDIVRDVQRARELSRAQFMQQRKKFTPKAKRKRRLSESSVASTSSVRSSASVYIPGFSFESPARIFSPKRSSHEAMSGSEDDGVPVAKGDVNINALHQPQEGDSSLVDKDKDVDDDLDQLDTFSSSLFTSTPWSSSHTKTLFPGLQSLGASPLQADRSVMSLPQSPLKRFVSSPAKSLKDTFRASPKKGKRKSTSFTAGF